MHVTAEIFTLGGSLTLINIMLIRFQKQRSILFHFRTLTSGSIFSSQNNRSRELSHTLITDLLEQAFTIPVEISVSTGFLSRMVPMNKRFEA